MDQPVNPTKPWQHAGFFAYAIIAMALIVVGVLAYTLPPDRGATGNTLIAFACTVPLLLAIIAVRSAWQYLTRP